MTRMAFCEPLGQRRTGYRDPNGYRRYTAGDLVRVLRIRQLAASGMSLRKIGSVLDMDVDGQEQMLEELDNELHAQAERIKAQRAMLAGLRKRSVRVTLSPECRNPTATEQLDQDVWTLATATGAIDAHTATTLRSVLQREPIEKQVADWYPEFEGLETCTSVDDARVDRLAAQMARFAEAFMDAAAFVPTDQEQPLMRMIEQLQDEAFSPAQQQVWTRFRSLIERRWRTSETAAGHV